jgi:hypothetical protein
LKRIQIDQSNVSLPATIESKEKIMAKQKQGEEGLVMTHQQSFNSLMRLVYAHAAIMGSFLHRWPGVNYPGMNALLGGVLLFVWAGFSRDPIMLYFFGIWLFMLFARRIETIRKQRAGRRCHSRYTGEPEIMRLPFFKDQLWVKRVLEPALCFGIGIALAPLSESLAWFVLLGFFSLGISGEVERQRDRLDVLAVNDAQIERELRADRIRKQSNDW